MTRTLFTGLAATALAVATLVSSGTAYAADAATAGRGPATDRVTQALEEQAARDGLAPVIVELDALAPVTGRSPSETAQRRRAVASAREGLVAELGGTSGLRSFRGVDDMPLVAFHATVGQLRGLERSGRVLSVQEDLEIELSDERGEATAGTPAPGTPDPAEATPTSGQVAATVSNGSATQLKPWWDYYAIGVNTARANGWTGAGQAIAVLDTGVDRNHQWLSGKVVNETCFATNTVGYTGGACPNGTNTQYGTGAAAPCTYSTGLCGHGTHVAHTAAGVNGVAPGAKILAVQIFHRNPTTGKPTYWESDLTFALNHVYNVRNSYRIAAVNMSIGGGGFTGYCDNTPSDTSTGATYLAGWINSLKGVGIPTVVASGNDNFYNGISRPACITNAISVGNTTLTTTGYDAVFGGVTGGSNSAATLDLLAPGTDICSAVPSWLDLTDGYRDGVDCTYIGTSMAAPHVAGAIAVMRQYRPSSSVDQLQWALQRSGTAVTDSRNNLTRTRIHVWNALSYI